MKRRTIIDKFMAEYVNWGGPVVTRAEALRDAQLRGLSRECIDVSIFARPRVPAPEYPEWNVSVMDKIREKELAAQ